MSVLQSIHELYGSWSKRRFEDAQLARAKMAFLDCLGCIVAGARTAPAGILHSSIAEFGGLPQASVFGTCIKTSVALAALANGVAGHVEDYDDMIFTGLMGHPSVVLVPAAMALGEAHQKSGKDILWSYVLGFEIDTQVGSCINPEHYAAGWHSTSSIGIFGATAAASYLLGLSPQAFACALGIAASNAAGLRKNFGSMAKSFHAGHAAERAVWAATLASKGFSANENVFDGDDGFLSVYAGPARGFTKERSLDRKISLAIDSVGIKPYACCGAGVSPIDAMLDLLAGQVIKAKDVSKIECVVSELARQIMPFDKASNGPEGKYCIEYCLAVTLLDGRAGLEQFSDERVASRDVQEIMARVQVSTSKTMVSGGARFGVELTLHLRNGSKLTTRLDTPRGHPERPLTKDVLMDKFMQCTRGVIDEPHARRVAELVARIEALDTVSALADALRVDA